MISIGKAIYSILINNNDFKLLSKGNLYPLVAPEGTELPLIIYERRGNTLYSKDGINLYNTDIDFTIITEKYNDGIELAQLLHNILNGYSGEVGGIRIRDIELSDYDEVYSDYYIQKVSFQVKNN